MNVRTLLRATGLAGAAIAVGAWTSSGRGRELDDEVFRALNRDRGPAADTVFQGVTELGSIWASAGAAAVLAAGGRRRAAARGLAAAGLTWLAGQGLKKVFGRPRPYAADPDGVRLLITPPRATSWPSSHPAVLLAFTSAAAGELGLGRLGRACLDATGLVVGASRSHVGVHYPADVVGGVLVGKAVAAVVANGRSFRTAVDTLGA
ncbi:MAG: phosphatase PAP2 family protein [Actinomycetota bacterium]